MDSTQMDDMMRDDARETVVNQLYDLRHDLAKYLRMPINFLPSDAPASELRRALARALHETYRRGGSIVPAAELWNEFNRTVPVELRGLDGFLDLETAVARALAWDRALEGPDRGLDRAKILADFSAIGNAIDSLIIDVEAEERAP